MLKYTQRLFQLLEEINFLQIEFGCECEWMGEYMRKTPRWLLAIVALVQIGNFVILQVYGDTLQSTHLFISRNTVFYPVAWLNLILGILLLIFLFSDWLIQKRNSS
jgi:hypothetical protein